MTDTMVTIQKVEDKRGMVIRKNTRKAEFRHACRLIILRIDLLKSCQKQNDLKGHSVPDRKDRDGMVVRLGSVSHF